jgi:hypothetical protein
VHDLNGNLSHDSISIYQEQRTTYCDNCGGAKRINADKEEFLKQLRKDRDVFCLSGRDLLYARKRWGETGQIDCPKCGGSGRV